MRQAPRHVAPRRHFLRADQRRHIVEHQHGPRRHALFALQRRRRGSQVQLPAVAGQGDLVGRRVAACRVRLVQQRPQRVEILAREQPLARRADHGAIDREQPAGGAVDGFDPLVGADGDDSRGDALQDRLDIPAPVFELQVLPLQRVLAGGQLRCHRVEGLDEGAELVAGLRLDAVIEMSRANLARALGEHVHGPRDALGQVEAHPRGADEDHQRHHQEEREVHALQRPRQEAQPAVVLVGRDDALRFDRQLAGELIARDDDAGRLPGHRIDDERARLHELAAARQRLVRDAGAPLRTRRLPAHRSPRASRSSIARRRPPPRRGSAAHRRARRRRPAARPPA